MRIELLILIICLFTSCNEPCKLGSAIITENHRIYEEEDGFSPFDNYPSSIFFVPNEPLLVEKDENYLLVTNASNPDGLGGSTFTFKVNSKLEIISADFTVWDDQEGWPDDEFDVENIILEFNKNPFSSNYFIGYYTIQLQKRNSTIRTVRNGKFKICNDHELKMGRERVKDSLQIEMYKGLI